MTTLTPSRHATKPPCGLGSAMLGVKNRVKGGYGVTIITISVTLSVTVKRIQGLFGKFVGWPEVNLIHLAIFDHYFEKRSGRYRYRDAVLIQN